VSGNATIHTSAQDDFLNFDDMPAVDRATDTIGKE